LILNALTDGKVSGTGTLTIPSGMLGGILISTNSSNAAVVTVQRDDANGKKVFDISTIAPAFLIGPVALQDTDTAYYSVTGTGASVQFYESVE
jgi:hypothetical protein